MSLSLEKCVALEGFYTEDSKSNVKTTLEEEEGHQEEAEQGQCEMRTVLAVSMEVACFADQETEVERRGCILEICFRGRFRLEIGLKWALGEEEDRKEDDSVSDMSS